MDRLEKLATALYDAKKVEEGAKEARVALEEEIAALAVTESGDVWAAAASGGVFYGSGDRWTELRTGDGLPAAKITAIVTSGEQVWLGGQDGGIGVFAPAE